MAGEGTKCCKKKLSQTNKQKTKLSKTLTKTNKERCVEENLEHDEVGGPPGQHDDGLVGQGGVHHLVDWLIDRLIGWLIDWLVGSGTWSATN